MGLAASSLGRPYDRVAALDPEPDLLVEKVSISPRADLILEAGRGPGGLAVARIVDYEGDQLVRSAFPGQSVVAAHWTADGECFLLVLRGNDDAAPWCVHRISVESGDDVVITRGHGHVKGGVAIDGGEVAVCGLADDGRAWARIVDATGALVDELEAPSVGLVRDVACGCDGTVAFLVTEPSGVHSIQFAGVASSKRRALQDYQQFNPTTLRRLSFANDGRHLLSEDENDGYALLAEGGGERTLFGCHKLAADGRCVVGVHRSDHDVFVVRSERHLELPWASFRLPGPVQARPDVVMRSARADVAIVVDGSTWVCRLFDPDELDLISEDPHRRRHGVAVAKGWPPERAIGALTAVLDSATSADRDGAVPALMTFDAQGAARLVDLAGRTNDRRVHEAIASPYPAEGTNTQLEDVLARAIEKGLRGTGSALLGALRLVGYVSSTGVGNGVRGFLRDGDPSVRMASAQALGHRRDGLAAPALLAATADSDVAVATAAASALCAIAGGPLPVGGEAPGENYVTHVLKGGRIEGANDEGFRALSSLLLSAGEVTDDEIVMAIAKYADREPHPGASRVLAAVHGHCLIERAVDTKRELALRVLKWALPMGDRQDSGPALTWRIHRDRASLVESEDPERAGRYYDAAVATIEGMWLSLLDEHAGAEFFRDKARLFDAALLSAVRLGHPARAVELLEMAKTRYLGDLIVRRDRRRRELAVVEQRLWRYDDDTPASGDGVRAESTPDDPEILGIRHETGGSSSTTTQTALIPANLARLYRSRSSCTFMVNSLWSWVGRVQRETGRAGPIGGVSESLDSIRAVLLQISAATESGSVPEAATAAALTESYRVATEQLRRQPYPWSSDVLWEGRGWLTDYFADPTGPDRFVPEALEEAVGFLATGTAVRAVPHTFSTSHAEDLPSWMVFDVGGEQRTAAGPLRVTGGKLPYILDRRRTWEFVDRIARGRSVGFSYALDIVRRDHRTAVLQFATTPEGTVTFATVSANAPPRAIVGSEDWRGPAVFTNRRVTTEELNARIAAGGGWLRAYVNEDTDKDAWFKQTEEVLEWLHKELFVPLEDWLRASGVTRLLVIPHRELHQFPLAAWRKSRPGRPPSYVVNDFDVYHAPSLTLHKVCAERAKDRSRPIREVAAILDPDGDRPLARTELTAFMPDATALTPPTFDRWAEAARSADWCHYAGHGQYRPSEPLESTLSLADGALELGELFTGGFVLPQSQVVTLSGCETAMTLNPHDVSDEHLGLASGFVFAGAPAVLSTLWVVDDIAAAMLVRRYYQHLAEGLRPSSALGRAQRWLRDDVRNVTVHRFLAEMRTLLERQEKLGTGTTEKLDSYAKKYQQHLRHPLMRPFEHPIYWAPFTVSGIDRTASVHSTP